MIIHYGYRDAQGDFRITIDTDKCDGCGSCLDVCPENIFQLEEDDYDEIKAVVKREMIKRIGIVCPGSSVCKKLHENNCVETCHAGALSISW